MKECVMPDRPGGNNVRRKPERHPSVRRVTQQALQRRLRAAFCVDTRCDPIIQSALNSCELSWRDATMRRQYRDNYRLKILSPFHAKKMRIAHSTGRKPTSRHRLLPISIVRTEFHGTIRMRAAYSDRLSRSRSQLQGRVFVSHRSRTSGNMLPAPSAVAAHLT
jgi:hypothetical protein